MEQDKNKLINMIMHDVILQGVRSFFPQLHSRYSFRLARCFSVWGRHTSCLTTSSFFVQTWSLMTSVLKSAALQNNFLFELFSVYSCIFFPLLPFYTALCWQLAAFASVKALIWDMLLHGLYVVMGAKVSWLDFQLSSVLQQLKWTCSESTLKNYFLLSRR